MCVCVTFMLCLYVLVYMYINTCLYVYTQCIDMYMYIYKFHSDDTLNPKPNTMMSTRRRALAAALGQAPPSVPTHSDDAVMLSDEGDVGLTGGFDTGAGAVGRPLSGRRRDGLPDAVGDGGKR